MFSFINRPYYRRPTSLHRLLRFSGLLLIIWSFLETLYIRNSQLQSSLSTPPPAQQQKNTRVYIASIHWNNEAILRSHWIPAVIDLVKELGTGNVYVSVQESGSWDDSKGALREFDAMLEGMGVERRIILNETTHLDEISRPPAEHGWIHTPRVGEGEKELRRIPYLARLRNEVMEPFYELQGNGTTFDKILWLNDVVFTPRDVLTLFDTRRGDYAAACSLDFSKTTGQLYDTFALRDIEGREQIMPRWPYFRARESRRAMKANLPVPVSSCWNGMVVMRAAAFYTTTSTTTTTTPSPPLLAFRGIADSLADSHLEGSECCLIHADNPLSNTKGVWINPNVRVGYNAAAYAAVNSESKGRAWVGTWEILWGNWGNRMRRWVTTTWVKEMVVRRRVRAWEGEGKGREENGLFCLINEMQVLIRNGWAHV